MFPIQILPNNVTNGICNPWHGILANITGWLDLQQCYLVQKTLKTRSLTSCQITYRNSHPEVFLGKAAQNICSKFTKKIINLLNIRKKENYSKENVKNVRSKFFDVPTVGNQNFQRRIILSSKYKNERCHVKQLLWDTEIMFSLFCEWWP